jgi:hypothetical protein
VLGAVVVACAPAVDRVAVTAGVRDVCDGVDNDGNGFVDDADADGDGLCDCLRIGVVGFPGEWGNIDLIRGWMHAREAGTVLVAGETLTPELLATLDVVLVQDVRDGVAEGTVGQQGVGVGIGRTYSDAEVRALAAWVEAGGGLMTLAGFTANADEPTNVNRLLAPFGLSYGAQHVLFSGGDPPISVRGWDAAHPIASGIGQVGVKGGRPVSGGALVAWESIPGEFDLGRVAQPGRGRVFAWADEWIEYDSEWSRPELQVRRLWQNALAWLTPPGRCRVALSR